MKIPNVKNLGNTMKTKEDIGRNNKIENTNLNH